MGRRCAPLLWSARREGRIHRRLPLCGPPPRTYVRRPFRAPSVLPIGLLSESKPNTDNRQTRERYIDALLAATGLDHAIPVYLALILRADFYANCLEHAQLSRVLETSLYNVPRMAVEQLHKSIEKRLSLAGGSAESGLIDSLLADVGAEPGDLALLEHALGLLWEKCGGAGCMLTNKAYSESGR